MDYEVRIEHPPVRYVAVVRFHSTLAGLGEQMAVGLSEVARSLTSRGLAPTGPAIGYYEPEPGGFAVAVGFPVRRELANDGAVVMLRLPETDVVTTTHMGRYEDLPHAYDALKQQAAGHGRDLDTSHGMWEEYWSPPGTPDDRTRTEVFWPLAPA